MAGFQVILHGRFGRSLRKRQRIDLLRSLHQHPGHGTVSRRFALANAMIELFWVSDPSEAQNESTRHTLLWERWSGREVNACPFGICLRPTDPEDVGPPPFPSWEYRPAYLPDPFVMHIGEAGIEEPMWELPTIQEGTRRVARSCQCRWVRRSFQAHEAVNVWHFHRET